MAQRAEAPTPRASALEELDAIDAEAVEGTEPGKEETGATPQQPAKPPADAAEADATEDDVLEREPPEGAAPAAWQPPEGGQPFRFTADHREVEVPGALEWDHGIYVPKDAWNSVVSRHLADRDGLQGYYQGQINYLQRQVEERDPERHPVVLEAQASLQQLRQLFDSGPQAVAEWLDNYAVNRPIFEAEARAQALQLQLQSRQSQLSEAEFTAAAQRAAEELPGYLEQNIAALISQVPELAELKGAEKDLVKELWPYARSIFWEADQDYPQHGVAQGQIVPRREVLEPLLRDKATRRAELKRLQDASKHNRAATGKATSPKTVPSRGKPVPAGPKKEYKPGQYREAKDDFMAWDPLADES